jgi:flagellar hook-associated protein 1 FlgK
MSLFTSLTSSASALDADSYALQITGKNLANTNNANYARETVVLGSSSVNQSALGASNSAPVALSVSQIRDAFLDKQVCKESSITSALTTQQSALQDAEAALGETVSSSSDAASVDAGASLSSQLTSLFNSFSSLAATPTDSGVRQMLLQNASTLSNGLNQTDAGLAQVQSDIDSQIQGGAATVNSLLNTIASLNKQITTAEVSTPGSAVDLRDQRQTALESLAAQISFTSSPATSGGQIKLTATDASGNPVVLVDGNTVANTVAFDGTNLTAGGATLSLTSGSIKGAMDARDGAIQTLRNSLDALARQLVTSVNAAYNPTGTTGNFFDAAGTTAGTIALDATLTGTNLKASDGGNAGDNTIALAVAGLASKQFSTGAGDAIDGTLTQYLSGTVSAFGQTVAALNNSVENQTSVETLVKTQRSSVSGVNIDEETTNLMMYQKAYEASSRFMSIIDNLLETLISLGTGA